MLTLAFQGQGQLQKLSFLPFADDIRHLGPALRDGAGLIQNNDIRFAGLLQRDGGLEEYAVFGAYAVADHNGNRSGKAQGAGAADDQNGDASCQRKGEFPAQQQPDNGGDDRNGDHRGHKHTGNPVRDLGNGGLGSRRVGDHFDDLGKGGVRTYAACPAAEKAGLVESGGRHAVAGAFVHGDALAGQGGFVDGTGALQNNAVHRDALAGTHYKDIVLLHLLDGNGHFLPTPDQRGGLGGQIHQTLQRVCGLAFGASLQHLAHGNQSQDHGGGLKIELVHIGHDPGHIPAELGIGHGEQCVDAPYKGRHGAKGYQGIHIGRAVPQSLEA